MNDMDLTSKDFIGMYFQRSRKDMNMKKSNYYSKVMHIYHCLFNYSKKVELDKEVHIQLFLQGLDRHGLD